ncbi:MAG: tetratricopeptide repeat protein [Chloroflexales bacterium]
MQNQHESDHWIGAIKTPQHVGRIAEIAQAHEALTSVETQPQVIFITGEGGIGKTRMLFRLLELARERGLTAANDLVDLYDIANHSDIWLSRAISERLSPPSAPFEGYQREWRHLSRLEVSGDVVELGSQRERTLEAFLEGIRALTQHRRVVLALDTAERLVYIVDEQNRLETEIAEEWAWLIRSLAGMPNLTLVVAGRKRMALLHEAIIHSAYAEQIAITTIELQPFTLEDSLHYFDAVAEAAKASQRQVLAAKLAALQPEFRTLAHQHANGWPITLALLVDLITIGEFGAVHELIPDEPTLETHSHGALVLSDWLQEKIVKRLIETPQLGDLLVAVGRLPKGANQELVELVLQAPPAVVRDGLQTLAKLSFVKARDEFFYLHDELYALLERHVYRAEEDRPQAIPALDAIVAYYKHEYNQTLATLNELYKKVEVEQSPELDRDTLTEVNNRRRALLPEMLYYQLRRDAIHGFHSYVRYNYEASISGDTTLDVQLQAAILGFLHDRGDPDEQQPVVDGLERSIVLGVALVRPVARAFARAKYDEAITRARQIRDEKVDLLENGGPATRAMLNVWEAGAHVRRNEGDDSSRAHTLLEEAIATVKPLVGSRRDTATDAKLWRTMSVLAYAHQGMGMLLWTCGEMEAATENYQKAIIIWREIKINVNLATALNDLGFVLAELGQTEDAEALVLDALALRRNLGTRAPVGYSLNTLALIDIYGGHYLQASKRAEQALALFRALAFPRGIALALNALAEATRRYSATEYAMGTKERINMLRYAREYAREAREITVQIREPLRQIQALIELGCATREWARIRRANPDSREDYQRIAAESREALHEAEQLASKTGLLLYQIIAMTNRAFLEYYVGNQQQAQTVGAEAFRTIPPAYYLQPETGMASVDLKNAQVQIWIHMGKLHTLFGHMLFDRNQAAPGKAGLNNEEFDEAIKHYLFALQYTGMYSSHYPGYHLTENEIYRRMKELPAADLYRVACAVRAAEQHYNLKTSTLHQLLRKRALWYQQ